jgi:DNA-binding IclR family transcriptional regulator
MQAVDRVVSILMCFTDGQRELGVTEISQALGLPKSAVHRVLEALTDSGMVTKQGERGKYRLGPRSMDLSLAALGTVDVRSLALPIMEALRDETGETVTMSARINQQRVYLLQVESREDVRMTVEVGRRAPLYAGASGRAILMTFTPEELDEYFSDVIIEPLTERTLQDEDEVRATLAEDARRGHTISFGERDPYAAAVAAPIFSRTSHAFGCISVCGPTSRLTSQLLEDCGEAVAEAAAMVSQTVGGR